MFQQLHVAVEPKTFTSEFFTKNYFLPVTSHNIFRFTHIVA